MQEIRISLEDIFIFKSQWWVAGEGLGIFPAINIGFMPKSKLKEQNNSNFLIIGLGTSSVSQKDISTNENIPLILEKLESWLYHFPDMAHFEEELKPKFDGSKVTSNTSKYVQRLIETKECPYCDLRNTDLSNANLKGANLEGANLEGANLEGANLKKAYLLGANLDNANLQNVDLKSSILTFSSLKNASLVKADLRAANLQNSELQDANLSKAKLHGQGLNITQLQNANLDRANLNHANLTCANLHGASLKKVNLNQANFKRCKVSAKFERNALTTFRLNGYLPDNRWVRNLDDVLDIAGAILSIITNSSPHVYSSIDKSSAAFTINTNLSSANLSGADLTEANLQGVDLRDSNLSGVILNLTKLENVNLSNANLIYANLKNIEMENSNLCNAIMPDLSISEQGCYEDIEDTEESEEKQGN